MADIDLASFRSQLAGRPFRELVEHQIRRQSTRELVKGTKGTILMLPSEVHSGLEIAIDEWNTTAMYSEFWSTDAAEVLDQICETGRRAFLACGLVFRDEDLFNFFQVINLNLSTMASEHRQLRKFAGIKKGTLFLRAEKRHSRRGRESTVAFRLGRWVRRRLG